MLLGSIRSSSRITASSSNTTNTITQRLQRTIPTFLRTMQNSTQAGSTKDASAATPASPVLFESTHSTRTFKLNRPKALNSLDPSIVYPLSEKIKEWRADPNVGMVLGVGDQRAFCAGGDVKAIAQTTRAGKLEQGLDFFKHENTLDYILAKLGKPYVVIMEGITMGGGAGLAYPAPLRVATSTTNFAMPETAIGFAPDVGASFYLAQLDGCVGAWLGVCGDSVFGRSVYELGIATHYVPQPALAGLVEAIKNLENPTLPRLASLITQHSEPAPAHPSTLPSEASSYSSKSNPDALSPICGSVRKLLDQAFSQSTVAKIYKVLNEAIDEDKGVWDDRAKQWARDQIKTMDTRSPTGMKIALGNYKQAKKYKDLRVQLNNDLAMCAAFLSSPTNDMVNSIFHKLIEKKKETPTWVPATLDDPTLDESKLMTTYFDREKSEVLAIAPLIEEISEDDGKSTWGTFRAWGIPSESAIKSYVDGSAKGSGAFALTEEQLKRRLIRQLAERFELDIKSNAEWASGIEARVSDVVARCCEVEQGHEEKYLRWKGYAQAKL